MYRAKFTIGSEQIDTSYQRVRKLIVIVFQGAVLANVILPLLLLLMHVVPEIGLLVYAVFYYLIWIVLPAAGVVLAVLAYRRWHGLETRAYLAKEFKWGWYTLVSYLLLILIFLLVK